MQTFEKIDSTHPDQIGINEQAPYPARTIALEKHFAALVIFDDSATIFEHIAQGGTNMRIVVYDIYHRDGSIRDRLNRSQPLLRYQARRSRQKALKNLPKFLGLDRLVELDAVLQRNIL
jgi:hypothetical protein